MTILLDLPHTSCKYVHRLSPMQLLAHDNSLLIVYCVVLSRIAENPYTGLTRNTQELMSSDIRRGSCTRICASALLGQSLIALCLDSLGFQIIGYSFVFACIFKLPKLTLSTKGNLLDEYWNISRIQGQDYSLSFMKAWN